MSVLGWGDRDMRDGIGPNVRYYRERKRMTQEQLAAELGYKNNSAIVKIENGTLDPSASMVSALAKALGVSIASLFNPVTNTIDASHYDEFEEYLPYLRAAEEWRIKAVRDLLQMPIKKESSDSMAKMG